MNGYICFYKGLRFEVHAESLYAAKLKAIAHFKPKKNSEHLVSVHLAEKDGEPVTHSGASL